MRVLHIVASWPTDARTVDGIILRDHALAASTNNDIRVIALDWTGKLREQPCEPPPTLRRRYPPGPIGQLIAVARLLGALTSLAIRERWTPDVVHSQAYTVAPHAWLTSRLFRRPWVHSAHWSVFERGHVTGKRLQLIRWLYRRADRILPISLHMQRVLEDHGITARYEIVWSAVDTSLFRPGGPGQASRDRLLTVGILDADDKKNIAGTLQALSSLDEGWTLTVIGDGPGRAGHEALVNELHIADRVMFAGQATRAEVADAMRNHDLLVHYSHGETFSVVVAEALACGLPVVARATGAIPEMLEATCGGVTVTSDDELTTALRDVLSGRVLFDRPIVAELARGILSHDRLTADLDRIYAEVSVHRDVG